MVIVLVYIYNASRVLIAEQAILAILDYFLFSKMSCPSYEISSYIPMLCRKQHGI